MKNYILLVIVVLTFSRCDKLAEAYVGMPMQPKNINAEFEEGINVFGVLKAGPTLDSLNNRFEAQMIVPIDDTTFIVNNANFTISLNIGDNYSFYHPDSIGNGEYHSPYINPQPGQLYFLDCNVDEYSISAYTLIPNKPQINENSIQRNGTNLSFEIQADSTSFMYDVYVLSSQNANFKRVTANKTDDTFISIDAKTEEPVQLYVFACDKNFEKYISTSNIFFKPNAFRPRFTTVEGGYGCFYSVSSALFLIE